MHNTPVIHRKKEKKLKTILFEPAFSWFGLLTSFYILFYSVNFVSLLFDLLNFCRAMLCLCRHASSVRLSVCQSVTFVNGELCQSE